MPVDKLLFMAKAKAVTVRSGISKNEMMLCVKLNA